MGCYFCANIKITDKSKYEKYLAGCDAVFEKYNGRYIAVDPSPRVLEGEWNYSRAVLIYFDSEHDFNMWYTSPEYQEILPFRLAGSECDTILVHDRNGAITVERRWSNDKDFLSLIRELDKELKELYQEKQDRYTHLNNVPDDLPIVLLYDKQIAIGCGCLKRINETCAELKRIYVKKSYRGKGLSKRIIEALEKIAKEDKLTELVLETGIRQTAAIGLYKSLGYMETENYGEYKGNSNSICMKKEI